MMDLRNSGLVWDKDAFEKGKAQLNEKEFLLIQGIKGERKGMDAYLKDQFDFTGVKAALLVEQSILVILRDNKPAIPWPNMWELTGGGREGLETPLECLRREVWEELGLILKEKSIIWSRIYPSMLDKDRSAVLWLLKLVRSSIRRLILEMKAKNLN